jgi:putative flavoprotein involved in K+ transport
MDSATDASGVREERHEAIVVGAGSAGLATAVALQRRGFETILLESSGNVGASWRSRYEEVHLNSWRILSNLRGYHMPRSYGQHPSRDNFVQYLEQYAVRNKVPIRYHTKVERVDRFNGQWRLATTQGDVITRYVVIATGFDAVARMPEWTGRESFGPTLLHSSQVRRAADYANLDVLVVGAGNSGIDLAGHLIEARATVTMSMRTPPNIAPRDILGLPGQALLVFGGDHIPPRVSDFGFALVQRIIFGDLRPYGVVPAPAGPYAVFEDRLGNPAIDGGFVKALKERRASVVGEVEYLDGAEVVLADERRLRPDVVICATGYRRGLESLVGHLGVLRPNGVPFAYGGAPP